jgi:hypothetical protein
LSDLAWTLFSINYYGFPFLNTAYAKQGAGIALGERLAQGWCYVMHGLEYDSLTAVFVAARVANGLAGRALNIARVQYTKAHLSGVAWHGRVGVRTGERQGDSTQRRYL